jgi:hypothetical protein
LDRLRRASAALVVVAALSAAGEAARGGAPPVPGAILTTVRVARAGAIASELRRCRGPGPREWTSRTIVVDRRSGRRRTLAFRSADGRFLDSCESIGRRVEGRRWCAPSTGMLFRGRLRDPRLTLCRGHRGPTVAFIWITPRPAAQWVGVLQGRRVEVYRAAAGLPIRAASDRHVRIAGSSATFFVRQYDARGRVLARQTIVARVAG